MAYKKLKPLKKDVVKKLETAFSVGADVSAACFYADITRQTYYNWIKSDKKLGEKFDRLRENPVLKAYQTVYRDLGQVDTAKWYLERRRKGEFSTKQEIESKNEETIVVKFAVGPSPFMVDDKSKKKSTSKTKKK